MSRRIALTGCGSEKVLIASPEVWDLRQFECTLAEFPDAFVVLDCLSDIFQPDPKGNEAIETRNFLKSLRALFTEYGANGFVIDHAKRASGQRPAAADYYGSVQKKAAARQMWSVERQLDAAGLLTNKVRIACEKMSEAERFVPFLASIDFADEGVAFGYDGPAPSVGAASTGAPNTKLSAVDKAKAAIRDYLRTCGPSTREAMGVRKGSSSRRAFAEMREDAEVVSCGRSKPEKFRLATADSGDATLELGPDGFADRNGLDQSAEAEMVQMVQTPEKAFSGRGLVWTNDGPDLSPNPRSSGSSSAAHREGGEQLPSSGPLDQTPRRGDGPGPNGPNLQPIVAKAAGVVAGPQGRDM